MEAKLRALPFSLPVAAALVSILAGCASLPDRPGPLPPLERVVAFANPATCEYAQPLAGLFEGLSVWNDSTERSEPGPPVRLPGFADPLVPVLEPRPDDYLSASLPLRGRWHGLTVTSIETIFLPETDDGANFIHFAEPRERVIATLNALGFGLDPRTYASEADVSDPDWDATVSLALQPHKEGSSLACAHNY